MDRRSSRARSAGACAEQAARHERATTEGFLPWRQRCRAWSARRTLGGMGLTHARGRWEGGRTLRCFSLVGLYIIICRSGAAVTGDGSQVLRRARPVQRPPCEEPLLPNQSWPAECVDDPRGQAADRGENSNQAERAASPGKRSATQRARGGCPFRVSAERGVNKKSASPSSSSSSSSSSPASASQPPIASPSRRRERLLPRGSMGPLHDWRPPSSRHEV